MLRKHKTNNPPTSFWNENNTPPLIHWTFEMPGTDKVESDLDVSDDESFYPDNRLLNENNEIPPQKRSFLSPIKGLIKWFDSKGREDNKPRLVIMQNSKEEKRLNKQKPNSVI